MSEETYPDEAPLEDMPCDAIAARAEAFTRLLKATAAITDDDLRKEAMQMLGALRRSFKTNPIGDLQPIK